MESSSKATKCHGTKGGFQRRTCNLWPHLVPAEDGHPSLAAQSVANICVEGGGSIAGHQSVMECSVSTSVEVEVASSDFLAASSVG